MDKRIQAAILPFLLLVVIQLILPAFSLVLRLATTGSSDGFASGFSLFILIWIFQVVSTILILAWAGWRANRIFKLGIFWATISAVLAAVSASLVGSFAITLLAVSSSMPATPNKSSLIFGLAFGAASAFWNLFFASLFSFLFGGAGSLLAGLQQGIDYAKNLSGERGAHSSGFRSLVKSELGKAWVAAKPAILLFVFLNVAFILLVVLALLVPFVGSIAAGLFGLIHLLLSLFILAWAGLLSARRFGGGWESGAKTGACVGFIGGLALGILGLLLSVLFGIFGGLATTALGAMGGPAGAAGGALGGLIGVLVGILIGLILLILAPLLWTCVGVILGAAGGYFAKLEQRKSGRQKRRKKR